MAEEIYQNNIPVEPGHIHINRCVAGQANGAVPSHVASQHYTNTIQRHRDGSAPDHFARPKNEITCFPDLVTSGKVYFTGKYTLPDGNKRVQGPTPSYLAL